MIKISVIVPVYNVEALLPRCLDSLVHQTLKEIEIICVNDASPDNSLEVLSRYAALYSHIRIVDLKENVCLGGARNRGIEIARGEFVSFIDSDDWVDVNLYEKLYNKAREIHADVVSCGFDIIDQDGSVLNKLEIEQKPFEGVITDHDRDEFILTTGGVWGKIYKRDLLMKHAIRFPEKLFYEDNYFVPITAIYIRCYAHIPECLYHYYENTESITRKRNSPNIYDRLTSLDMLISYFRKHKLIDKFAKSLDYFCFRILANTLFMYLNSYDTFSREFLEELKNRLREKPVKSKQKHRFYYSQTTCKERIGIKIFMLHPASFLFIWNLIRSMKNKKKR